MKLLESRASRMGTSLALKTLHADFIGGASSNFKTWYFAAEMDLDDGLDGNEEVASKEKRSRQYLQMSEAQWYNELSSMSPSDYVTQIALYLLCWGEANNIRFMPECICFIFKCCNDYFFSDSRNSSHDKPSFLDDVITPMYMALKTQCYREQEGKLQRADKDHASIVGYDDFNQVFWYRASLQKIALSDKTSIMNLRKDVRFLYLKDAQWDKVITKTYRETRTWLHVIVNFNRVINLHIAMFWYFTSYHSYPLYTPGYDVFKDNQPVIQLRLTIMALAGAITTFISLLSVLLEGFFVPRGFHGAQLVLKRSLLLLVLLALNVGPTVAIVLSKLHIGDSSIGVATSIGHLFISIASTVYLVLTPPSVIFTSVFEARNACKSFTSNFHQLKGTDKIASIGLWTGVFLSKFIETYFFLALPFRDPMRELSVMTSYCVGDAWIGAKLCHYQPMIILVLVLVLQLVLFYLDTYLWYVIWSTVFSVLRSFYLGTSIWTPWRNIFSRLPKRIFSKLLATTNKSKSSRKLQVSKLWNSIIISMYREHFLSIEQVQKLFYQRDDSYHELAALREPIFFTSQEDETLKSSLFFENSEAQRRITFFAQSLSTPMPEVKEVKSMPVFSVFIPHYGEKIILLLKEIIKEDDRHSNVTLIEYLKQLYPLEWNNFVRDTKMMAEEFEGGSSETPTSKESKEDIPFHTIGFKSGTPEYIMRTRVWASLRSQTLYRTVSGFMNYSRALKLLYDLETERDNLEEDFDEERISEIKSMALRKFRIIVSMQRFQKFNEEELESTQVLLRAYPELQIAYVDERIDDLTGAIEYFSCLIDGTCAVLDDGTLQPIYRIRLSGYPILGDGKSDNQNHAVVFTRGEYLQLIDANQDNYIEECLKIRNVLAEFEEQHLSDPYNSENRKVSCVNPVAIIGTREYIFSENIGILGDIAAGKEQTFGTLFARSLAQIGGKLHYGHPDFLNSVFMNTRGGISKAQKGLHLNEDIYAGMTAISRGGRIKHCEYMQCGKGRDLGLTSILNFITKIGTGMGEQILSRDYFYLGTQLPLDRFLSFFYAHVGFHLNNVLIVSSIQLFLLVGVNLAAFMNDSVVCNYDRFRPITDPRTPDGCHNLVPVLSWLHRCVVSIFLVFFMSFLPLGVQELTERGIYKSLTRLAKHILSLSPLFEVFVCKIYSHSLTTDLALGGANYIATGRGFATRREAFADLYTRFANESLKFGGSMFLLVIYFTINLWSLPFIFFWLLALAMVISPFLYNPNQFCWREFFLDYREFSRWLHSGNAEHSNRSWITFTKMGRSRYTGVKPNIKFCESEVRSTGIVRPSRFNILVTTIIPEAIISFFIGSAFLFANAQNGMRFGRPTHALRTVILVATLPILFDMTILLVFFVVSATLGVVMSSFFKSFPSAIATIVHFLSLMGHVASAQLLWYSQKFDLTTTIVGLALVTKVQKFVLLTFITMLMTREYADGRSNRAWWSGKWFTAGLGWRTFTQPLREFGCKITELSYFSADFVLGHAIFYLQVPFLLIPFASTWHSIMLLWLKPGSQLRQPVLTRKENREQLIMVFTSIATFVLNLVLFACVIVLPYICIKYQWLQMETMLPQSVLQFL